MHNFYSPLRYPGGKGRIASYFKEIYKTNSLYDGIYIEPYAGGASVALSLLFNQYASKIIINDIDRSIYAFWHSVINNTEKLCKLIYDTPLSINVWQRQKEIQKKKKKCGLLTLGFSTFYLNRTNRSGIINAGVIGGVNQNGDWKIDARFNKKDLINRIERVADYSSQIEIFNCDAINLTKSLKNLTSKALFYFDPPYYSKGRELYLNFYEPSDHESVARNITKIKKHHWVVSYDDEKAIRQLYKNYRQSFYKLNYSAANKPKGKEIMIFSDRLHIPKLKYG